MGLITAVEQAVLDQLNEIGTTADNWSGADEIRDAVCAALDELLALGKFRREKIIFSLAANTSVYAIVPENGTMIGIFGARYLDESRPLRTIGFTSLSSNDPRFLLTRGSPWAYIPMDFSKVFIYPCPSTAVGAVELDALVLSSPYTTYEIDEDIGWEWTGVLVDGALAYMYLLLPGEAKRSAASYQRFLVAAGASSSVQRNWQRFLSWQRKGAHE